LKDFKSNSFYDLIYFDAFAPRKQPELWNLEVFNKLFNLTSINGTLVTYCAKGQVRRDLESAGFKVERLNGPPGKREMLRATKI
jgi:tRNA U34 5-methylaminomethyl-2-thiouridine-forming methyltransferase MnmC